uniref:Uncharacterized protein n=1 Tax=Coccidioides posadasii RMSCC 3488 TaxID=454284 RepID=A0A0J6FEB5_COCPO|nr:hypothetical protein CPAG_04963 [Coccidioides posadasii RMSCC 3488]
MTATNDDCDSGRTPLKDAWDNQNNITTRHICIETWVVISKLQHIEKPYIQENCNYTSPILIFMRLFKYEDRQKLMDPRTPKQWDLRAVVTAGVFFIAQTDFGELYSNHDYLERLVYTLKPEKHR